VDVGVLQQRLDEVFDHAVVFHGFTDYMRDYEVVFFCVADPTTGIEPEHVRYLFKCCVVAAVRSTLSAHNWRASLDERLIHSATGEGLVGYVWGVRWQVFYPGATIIADSPRAEQWSKELSIPFHEVVLEGNGHMITLVFSELVVLPASAGYTPFVVKP
jgi:hypothetical protein